MSGAAARLSAFAPITLYVRVNADGGHESPGFAAVILDDPFLASIRQLRDVVRANRLAYGSAWAGPAQWGTGKDNYGDDWNMHAERLEVGEDQWFYTGAPDNADYYVFTEALSLEDTLSLIEEARAAGRSYALHNCDEDELVEAGVLPARAGLNESEEQEAA